MLYIFQSGQLARFEGIITDVDDSVLDSNIIFMALTLISLAISPRRVITARDSVDQFP